MATPATAPLAALPHRADPDAEAAVGRWLAGGDLSNGGRIGIDDGWTGQPTPALLDHDDVAVDSMFSAGRQVAFHLAQRGRYLGGIDLADAPVGAPVGLRCTGMVTVDDEEVVAKHLVCDRVGLRRDLLAARTEKGVPG